MKKSGFLIFVVIVIGFYQGFAQYKTSVKAYSPEKFQFSDKKPDLTDQYCSSTYTNQSDDWITNVNFNTINNPSGQNGANSYGDYDTINTGLLVGETYSLSVTFHSGTFTQHVRAWIDWNGDEVFSSSESYYLGSGVETTLTTNITVPVGATVGDSRMRIIEQYNTDPGADGACDGFGNHTATYGETEDYSLLISSNNYCSASGGCDEFISLIEFKGIIDLTYLFNGCAGYYEWLGTSGLEIPINGAAHIEISNGFAYPDDQCGIWVDWNKDNDFDDSGETISVSGTPGVGPYSAFIIPPPGTALTDYHVRTRIVYNQTPTPCGSTTWGEVEDFHFAVIPETQVEWTGFSDNNWHNPLNWNTNKVPDATTDVTIPDDAINICTVWAFTAYCNNITVRDGSGNDLRIWNQNLEVTEDMNVHGQVQMDHDDGKIIVGRDIYWKSGSQANIEAEAEIEVHRDWKFEYGANVNMDDGTVSFSGSENGSFASYDHTCYFNNVLINKTNSAITEFGFNSYDIHINGDIVIEQGSELYISSPESLFLQGNLMINGMLNCNFGTIVFNGIDQMIFGGPNFYNLTINSSVKAEISGGAVNVSGNLTIESGQLVTNDHDIIILGYWDNQVGPDGFIEGNGTVDFFGSGRDIICDETFNTLHISFWNDTESLNIDGYTITCQNYDWYEGYIRVSNGGAFTANNLENNGIYGGWQIDNTGGTIDLTNTGPGKWVDLNGDIRLYGGTMTVHGGETISYWPYLANASIEMTDGVLDFRDQGIYITDFTAYTLTENITGGIIRIAGNFLGESSAFTPDFGTLEIYGGTDAYLSTSNGCYLNKVEINKSTTKNQNSQFTSIPNLFKGEESKIPGAKSSKSNTVFLSGNTEIKKDLIIQNGSFDLNGNQIDIENNLHVYDGTLVMNNTLDSLFCEGSYWYSGSGADASAGFISFDDTLKFFSGSDTQFGVGHTFYSTNVFNVISIICDESNISLGKLILGDNTSKKTSFIEIIGAQPLNISSDLEIISPYVVNVETNLHVNENLVINAGYFRLNDQMDIDIIVDQSLIINDGVYDQQGNASSLVHGNLEVNPNGWLRIVGGEFTVDAPYIPGSWININGQLTMVDGSLNILYRDLQFAGMSNGSISGGTIRAGRSFFVDNLSSLTPTGGTFEFIGTGTSNEIDCEYYPFYDLVINKESGATVDLSSQMYVLSDLSIQGGTMNALHYSIHIYGNWNNTAGTGGFNPGTGRVIFEGGNYHQYCSDETFNILEIDKPLGGAFRMQGTHVVCEQYDWTAGAVDVIPGGGSFTANDLFDSGIFGEYYLNPGGTINLSNYDGYMDLNGELHIFGGVMNIYGGTSISYWPFLADAEISMYDGVLNFHDIGIKINDSPSYTLTESISGGTIKTAGGFWGESGDFTPEHGTLEFYGDADALIYTINGSSLNDVKINKASKGATTSKIVANYIKSSTVDERSGKSMGDGTKSNKISLGQFLDINGDLTIDNGVLNSAGYDIQIAGDWTNNVGDAGFMESTGWVTFDGANSADILTNESFNNLMLNKTYEAFDGLELQNGITVHVTNMFSLDNGTMEMNANANLDIDGNLFIANEAGLNADDGNNLIELAGDWTNENSDYTPTRGFWPEDETVIFDGTSDQYINPGPVYLWVTNLTVDKSSGDLYANTYLYLMGNFHGISGTLYDDLSNGYMVAMGDFTLESTAGFHHYALGFAGSSDQYFTNNNGDFNLAHFLVNKIPQTANKEGQTVSPPSSAGTKGNVLTLNSDLSTTHLQINWGTLFTNGKHIFTESILVNGDATLSLNEGSALSISNYLEALGEIISWGTSGNPVHIYNFGTGYYDFEIWGTGTISANYTLFEDMNDEGIYVNQGTVNTDHPFDNCIFGDAESTPGSARLQIENTQTLTIEGVKFSPIPGGPDVYNVRKINNQGELTFMNTSGDFTGPLYEQDPNDRIHWPEFVPGLWEGNISSDWFDPLNWGDQQVPGTGTDVVIPDWALNDPVINTLQANCNSINIETGASLEIGNNELLVAGNIQINGELKMNNTSGALKCDEIIWQPGSTDDVTAGEIHANYWFFEDGTNAQLGTGNTAFITSYIGPFDADASFGNLEIAPVKGKEEISVKGNYPVRISGDCLMQIGISWFTPGVDWIIDGDWELGSGSLFYVTSGANITCHSDMYLHGTLGLETGGEVLLHGMFNFSYVGTLDIDDGMFICDYNQPNAWIWLEGDIKLSSGSIEFPYAGISFAGTSSISGGTIVAGRTVEAKPTGALKPSGGTIELIGSSIDSHIQINNGNYLHDLVVNRSNSILIHAEDDLAVHGTVVLNSEFHVSYNTSLTVLGDININTGGILSMGENSIIEMDNNRWFAINNGGTVEAIGTSGNEATITSTSGHYNFWIGDGATISAEHTIFEYMGNDGIHLNYGSIVDPAHSFNNCVFQNGAVGGSIITIDNIQDFTVNNAEFPTNTWGSVYNVYKTSAPGGVTFMEATGDFSGSSFEYDPNNLVHWTVPGARLDLTVFLEGPFNGTSMEADINPQLPTNHPFQPPLPYFGNAMPVWYYTGSENVGSIPAPGIVDWVLVELRDAQDVTSATPGTIIARQAAFLLVDGSIVDLDGLSQLNFSNTINNQLFVAVWHRNHIGVISANPLVQNAGVYTYDFSSGSGQAYGGSSGHKDLGGGTWGMFSGDADGNGDVNFPDKTNVWMIQSGKTGYLESDFNFDTHVNNKDKNDYWLPNKGKGSQIP